jgi:hypothetical protein
MPNVELTAAYADAEGTVGQKGDVVSLDTETAAGLVASGGAVAVEESVVIPSGVLKGCHEVSLEGDDLYLTVQDSGKTIGISQAGVTIHLPRLIVPGLSFRILVTSTDPGDHGIRIQPDDADKVFKWGLPQDTIVGTPGQVLACTAQNPSGSYLDIVGWPQGKWYLNTIIGDWDLEDVVTLDSVDDGTLTEGQEDDGVLAILGYPFDRVSGVKFGGHAVEFTVEDRETMVVTIPAEIIGEAGKKDLVATATTGDTDTLEITVAAEE